jgi:hypothetical protein
MGDRSLAWHQSTIELIGNCSWKYFLTYVIGLPDPSGSAAQTGTAVHAAVEAHERARMEGREMSMEDMQSMVVEGLDPDQSTSAVSAVKNWYSSTLKNGGESHRDWVSRMTPISIEEYFNFPLVEGAMPIGGTIDAIYLDLDARYHVVDLKTAKDMSRWKESGEGKRLQATMYSVSAQLRFHLDYLPQVTYTVARSNRTGETARRITIQPDLEDVRVLGQKIREAQQVVNTEDYVKNPGWNLCRAQWCSHYQGCMVTGELSGTPVTVKARFERVDL